jgi:YHS domain-containing protein
MTEDSVCGLTLYNKSKCKSTFAEQISVFCGSSRKTTIDKEPRRYAAPAGEEIQRERRP